MCDTVNCKYINSYHRCRSCITPQFTIIQNMHITIYLHIYVATYICNISTKHTYQLCNNPKTMIRQQLHNYKR